MNAQLTAATGRALEGAEAVRRRLAPWLPEVANLKYFDAALGLFSTDAGSELASAMATRYQLGLLGIPKSGPKHTRLDHTLGVMVRTAMALETLRAKGLKLHEYICYELMCAVALHDSAHVPISHAAERAFVQAIPDVGPGVKHEERAAALLATGATSRWAKIRATIDEVSVDFGSPSGSSPADSVAWLICESIAVRLASRPVRPHMRIVSQILSSPIDVDRIDFLARDAQACKYAPVESVSDGFWQTLFSYDYAYSRRVFSPVEKDDWELAVRMSDLPWSFSLLVSRLLMYKNVYFHHRTRSLEGTFSRSFSQMIAHDLVPDPVELIDIGDDDFMAEWLPGLVKRKGSLLGEGLHRTVREDMEQLRSHAPRFEYLAAVQVRHIQPDSLKEHVRSTFRLRGFAGECRDTLKSQMLKGVDDGILRNRIREMAEHEMLIDPFYLKAEQGDPLWALESGSRDGKKLVELVNGSNIHGLAEEERIDFYLARELLDDGMRQSAQEALVSIFGKDAVESPMGGIH